MKSQWVKMFVREEVSIYMLIQIFI